MKQEQTTKTPTTFADIVTAYNNDPNNPDTLTTLATATAYSVLKKIVNATGGANKAMVNIRRDLSADLRKLENQRANIDTVNYLTYDKNGNIKRGDDDLLTTSFGNDLLSLSFGDGLDLVNDAVVAILDETEKQLTRDPSDPVDLFRPYTVHRLKARVYYKSSDTVGGWEDVETTPMREVYKAVRRSIQNNRHIQIDPRNGYTYLEDMVSDPETGEHTTVYHRLPKYADMGGDGGHYDTSMYGAPAGLDGRPTIYSADHGTVEQTERLVASLNLTDKQAAVLSFRMRGYGDKATATAMGISVNSVKGAIHEIRRKAENKGLTAVK